MSVCSNGDYLPLCARLLFLKCQMVNKMYCIKNAMKNILIDICLFNVFVTKRWLFLNKHECILYSIMLIFKLKILLIHLIRKYLLVKLRQMTVFMVYMCVQLSICMSTRNTKSCIHKWYKCICIYQTYIFYTSILLTS